MTPAITPRFPARRTIWEPVRRGYAPIDTLELFQKADPASLTISTRILTAMIINNDEIALVSGLFGCENESLTWT